MRRSQNGHLSDEYLNACRFELTMVLVRLTTGRLYEDASPVEAFARPPVCESTAELALYCRRYLAANRMQWTSFLTRQVSEALERIDNGSYGTCPQCGEPISAKRLAALPWVVLCTGCQEENPGTAQRKRQKEGKAMSFRPWGVILAGGDGTRLKAVSRLISGDNRPKQFCALFGSRSLLARTRERLAPAISEDRMIFAGVRDHELFYRPELADVDESRIVVQPANRGTTAAIIYSLLRLTRLKRTR